MNLEIHPRVVANFFLDGAKIVFGSLVVGAFMPKVGLDSFPWLAFLMGVVITTGFFLMANLAAHKEDSIKINQQVK